MRAALGDSVSDARVLVAFSGGLDSTVLLHAAVQALPVERLCAAHVDHALQPESAGWAVHCAREAAALGVEFHVRRLAARPARGDSLEAWAREARYAALAELAREAGAAVLLTAHHADDQLETFLIRLARGTGLDGLAGIPAESRREGLRLLRPFLRLPRHVLADWARARSLAWIDDPSNADRTLLRNAIRRELAPVVDRVLPGLREHLPETLDALAQARALLHARQQADLQAIVVQSADFGLALSLSGWRTLPGPRRAGVLREWLALHGARMPSRARLAAIAGQLDSPRGDASPAIRHEGRLIRRYRDLVVCVDAGEGGAGPPRVVPLRWDGAPRLECRELGGTLRIERVREEQAPGLAAGWLSVDDLQLRARVGGERLREHPGGARRSLKNLFQEHGVPPWVRPTLPVLWAGGRPVWVPRIGVDADCRATSGERYRLSWTPGPADLDLIK